MLHRRLQQKQHAGEVGIGAQRPPLIYRCGLKSLSQPAHRNARPATLAGATVGDGLRASEDRVYIKRSLSEAARFPTRWVELFAFLLAHQIGPRRRRGRMELRSVADFPHRAFSHSPGFCRSLVQRQRSGVSMVSQSPHDDNACDDVVQAALLGLDQGHKEE